MKRKVHKIEVELPKEVFYLLKEIEEENGEHSTLIYKFLYALHNRGCKIVHESELIEIDANKKN